MTKRYPFEPDYVVAPGETIQESMITLNLNKDVVALKLGISVRALELIVLGKGTIDGRIAECLHQVFGPSTQFWLNLEANYRKGPTRPEQPQ